MSLYINNSARIICNHFLGSIVSAPISPFCASEQLIDKNIALTGCPTRYAFQLQTSPDDLAMMTGLLERGVVISLSSDDPAQFGSGWLSQTLIEAQRTGNLSWKTMTTFMRNGFISAWLPSDRKVAYLQEFDRFCDAIPWRSGPE